MMEMKGDGIGWEVSRLLAGVVGCSLWDKGGEFSGLGTANLAPF